MLCDALLDVHCTTLPSRHPFESVDTNGQHNKLHLDSFRAGHDCVPAVPGHRGPPEVSVWALWVPVPIQCQPSTQCLASSSLLFLPQSQHIARSPAFPPCHPPLHSPLTPSWPRLLFLPLAPSIPFPEGFVVGCVRLLSSLSWAGNVFAFSPACLVAGLDSTHQARAQVGSGLVTPCLVVLVSMALWALRCAGATATSGGVQAVQYRMLERHWFRWCVLYEARASELWISLVLPCVRVLHLSLGLPVQRLAC